MPPIPSRRATRYAPIRLSEQQVLTDPRERCAVRGAEPLRSLRRATLGAHEHAVTIPPVRPDAGRTSDARPPTGRPPAQLLDLTSPVAGAQIAATPRVPDVQQRPRERLLRNGSAELGDEELLALILGTGVRNRPARTLAAELVTSAGGVSALSRASPHELAQVSGIGSARAARVAAAFELGRRAVDVVRKRETVGRAEDVYRVLAPRMAGLEQELFIAIGVDVRNGLLEIVEVARGTVLGVEVHPREVFRPLVRMAAAGAVLAHNHPSGDPTPSQQDIELTQRLREVGNVIGIPVIDHVVIGDRSFRSIAEWMGTEY